jgi:hypothetical protein
MTRTSCPRSRSATCSTAIREDDVGAAAPLPRPDSRRRCRLVRAFPAPPPTSRNSWSRCRRRAVAPSGQSERLPTLGRCERVADCSLDHIGRADVPVRTAYCVARRFPRQGVCFGRPSGSITSLDIATYFGRTVRGSHSSTSMTLLESAPLESQPLHMIQQEMQSKWPWLGNHSCSSSAFSEARLSSVAAF